MEKKSFNNSGCAFARTLSIVGEWWSPLIIRDIFVGVNNFDALVDNLEISRNLLTRRLTHLLREGIIEILPNPKSKKIKIYGLTGKGKELVPIIVSITNWGHKWAYDDMPPPIKFVHKDCGNEFEPIVKCNKCDHEINSENIIPKRGAFPKYFHGIKGIAKIIS